MKILLLYEYPPNPSGLATQGDLLYKGLRQLGVDTYAAHYEADLEKEWYYRWFKPDVVIGVGYWGYIPQLVHHPHKHGMLAIPWLVADGYIANYQDTLNSLPLLLVTSHWVKDVYVRDGIRGDTIEVLPVGCETDRFHPRLANDPEILAVRESIGVLPDELLILTIGGDAASKGAQEVMQALAIVQNELPPWKYMCKVWPQSRTAVQSQKDLDLADELGIRDHILITSGIVSRNYMPYLISACDIYAAPSRLEGFGMPHVEANACGKPVISIQAMAMLDTLVHEQTALLARVARENLISETVLGTESGFEPGHRIVFPVPRIADYRADVGDIAEYLVRLAKDPQLRKTMGVAGRDRVVEKFDYRIVAQKCLNLLESHLGITG